MKIAKEYREIFEKNKVVKCDNIPLIVKDTVKQMFCDTTVSDGCTGVLLRTKDKIYPLNGVYCYAENCCEVYKTICSLFVNGHCCIRPVMYDNLIYLTFDYNFLHLGLINDKELVDIFEDKVFEVYMRWVEERLEKSSKMGISDCIIIVTSKYDFLPKKVIIKLEELGFKIDNNEEPPFNVYRVSY